MAGEIYCIVVEGLLDPRWSNRFGGLVVEPAPHGTTRLVGEVADQAALHGHLARIRDLGLTLISLERVEQGDTSG